MLWSHTSGLTHLWTLDTNDQYAGHQQYGPYPDWTTQSYHGSDGSSGAALQARDVSLDASSVLRVRKAGEADGERSSLTRRPVARHV